MHRALLTTCLFAISITACGGKLPKAVQGPAADRVAAEIEAAVNLEAWKKTGAVRWTFAGRNRHLWDRQRELIRVRTGDTEVLRWLWEEKGRAWEAGVEVTDPDDLRDLLADAYAAWVNDAFWLNPFGKMFDPGVSRGLVEDYDGQRGLLITFQSGGLTPGDSYLFLLGPDGLPTAWRMWVSIIPIGGMGTTWEGWVELSTGAKIATRHATSLITLEIGNLAGAATLAELEPGADPFARLFEKP